MRATIEAVQKLLWEEMQALFAAAYAEEIVALHRAGEQELVREKLASLSAGERRVLREALAASAAQLGDKDGRLVFQRYGHLYPGAAERAVHRLGRADNGSCRGGGVG